MSEEVELKINYDCLNNFKNLETIEAKFNVMTAIQPKAYDSDNYKPEERIVLKNEKGEDEIKEIPLVNYIRWRNIKKDDKDKKNEGTSQKEQIGYRNTDGSKKIESNAKIVEWSDGTSQLIIGQECYDIMMSNMDNVRFGIADKEHDVIIVNKPVKQRMLLTLSEDSSNRKTDNKADQNESNLKVKLAYSYYDKQSYNKEEFANKFPKKKPAATIDKKTIDKLFKKRKRSGSNFD